MFLVFIKANKNQKHYSYVGGVYLTLLYLYHNGMTSIPKIASAFVKA